MCPIISNGSGGGGGGSLPSWWTVVDAPPSVEMDGFVKVAPTVGQALTNGAFTIKSPVGSVANETDMFYLRDEGGNIRILMSSCGGFQASERAEGTDGFKLGGNQGTNFTIDANGVAGIHIGTNAAMKVGFYDAAAVAQQTGVAVTAAGIHAALVALGLITA